MVRKAFPLQLIVALVIAFLAVSGVVAAGSVLREDARAEAQSAATTTTTQPAATTTTVPPTTTATLPLPDRPDIVVLPAAPLFGWGIGDQGPEIQAYEQRLHDLRFDPGPVDGIYDQKTSYSLEAVQKLAGLPRNGRLGLQEQASLENFQYAMPLHATAEPNRTEIDVTKQVITVYENYQVQLITTTSTASGETFCYVTPKKAPTQRICEVATTPSGRYTYYFFYDGWHDGDLGGLYNPYYFFKGRAIHGYEQVPVTPASHGCARIPMHIAEYFHTLVAEGEPVYVDGGTPEKILSTQSI